MPLLLARALHGGDYLQLALAFRPLPDALAIDLELLRHDAQPVARIHTPISDAPAACDTGARTVRHDDAPITIERGVDAHASSSAGCCARAGELHGRAAHHLRPCSPLYCRSSLKFDAHSSSPPPAASAALRDASCSESIFFCSSMDRCRFAARRAVAACTPMRAQRLALSRNGTGQTDSTHERPEHNQGTKARGCKRRAGG